MRRLTKEEVKIYVTACMSGKNDLDLPFMNKQVGHKAEAFTWREHKEWELDSSYRPKTGSCPLLGGNEAEYKATDNHQEQAAVVTIELRRDECTPGGKEEMEYEGAEVFFTAVRIQKVTQVGYQVYGTVRSAPPKDSKEEGKIIRRGFPDNSFEPEEMEVKLMAKVLITEEEETFFERKEYWVDIDAMAESKEALVLMDAYMAETGEWQNFTEYGPVSSGAKESLRERKLFVNEDKNQEAKVNENQIYSRDYKSIGDNHQAEANCKKAIILYRKQHTERSNSLKELKQARRKKKTATDSQ